MATPTHRGPAPASCEVGCGRAAAGTCHHGRGTAVRARAELRVEMPPVQVPQVPQVPQACQRVQWQGQVVQLLRLCLRSPWHLHRHLHLHVHLRLWLWLWL